MTHTRYEIRIAGLVPDDAVAQLGDVRVTTTDVSTVLSGELVDQAALLGVLARLRSLSLDVVEVRQVPVVTHVPVQDPGPSEEQPPGNRSGP